MIIFNLKCFSCDFTFEGWFENSTEYLKQNKKNLINCPSCESTNIDKGLMAPNLNKKSNSKSKITRKSLASNVSKLKKIVEKNFDYVGDNFPREVRKVYYDKKKNKNIYGIASPKETEELKEEGIDLATIPWVDNKEN